MIQLGCIVWISNPSVTFFFINRHHPCGWIAVVFWLNYLIVAIDLWGSSTQYFGKCTVNSSLDSFTLLHIHHAASHGFHCHALVWLIKCFLLLDNPVVSQGRITEWLQRQHFLILRGLRFYWHRVRYLWYYTRTVLISWVFLLSKRKKIPLFMYFFLVKVPLF